MRSTAKFRNGEYGYALRKSKWFTPPLFRQTPHLTVNDSIQIHFTDT